MNLPDTTNRILICGQTGSGKTVAGLWHLSNMPLEEMPAIVFDFKGDTHIAEIPFSEEIPLENFQVPKFGLRVIRPIPGSDDNERVEEILWKIYRTGNTIVYFDEGYMIDKNSKALNALLTQGRSKHLPIITLTQRPVFLNRFAVSEAEFHQVFFLSDFEDRKRVQSYVRGDIMDDLPVHWSYYYDVAAREFLVLKPVPSPKEIMDVFSRKLKPPKRKIL